MIKQRFSCSSSDHQIICRDNEIEKIQELVDLFISNDSKNFSLYIYGLPGSGKTSSLHFATNKFKASINLIYINCSNISTNSIFDQICRSNSISIKNGDAYKSIVKYFSQKNKLPG